MKFGDQLSARIYEPWRPHYLQYNQMKTELKRRQLERGWNSTDETEFSHKLESELAKVYQFIERGLRELSTRIEQANTHIQYLESTSTKSKKKYDIIADTLTEILFDCNDLAKFYQLNATGFEKIVKKHDRWTRLDLNTRFRNALSTQWPLDKLSLQFDVMIVKISKLHDVCNLNGNTRSNKAAYSQGGDQTAFERATAKYWVHPDNITEVKSIILFHLPVHVFDQGKQYEESDMAVSSVYYDNNNFDLYNERLHREEGAEAVRLRWYGPLVPENDAVYVERKTHHAAWLDGKSVKDRFRLKEAQVDSFISGKYTADQFANDLRTASKLKENYNKSTEATIKDSYFIASGVQKSVKERSLAPMCRIFYNRTAFQLPGDQRLRISLDSNLTFIREDNNQSNHWKRDDVGINYPFRNVDEKEISRFPYAILETKLQTHLGQESPAWLTSLIESHLVHEVPRFSKYIHGAAMLFRNKIPVIPYWIPHFDLDIKKEPVTNVGLSRSMSFKPLVNGHHRQSLLLAYKKELNKPNKKYTKSISLGDLRMTSILDRKKSKARNLPHLSINLNDSTEDEDLEGQHYNKAPQSATTPRGKDMLSRIWNYGTPISANLSISNLSSSFANKKEAYLLPRTKSDTADAMISRKGKKKMEPKTFFANERTFISWLQFCALLLTVALNLLNNGDRISRIIGAVFIIISSLLACYALGRFQLRSWQLRTNKQILRYDDVWGPTVLCVLLVTALLVNFYLRADTLSASYHEAAAVIEPIVEAVAQ